MGHDKRIEKITFFLLRRKFHLGLLTLLPAFFFLFAAGAFLPVLAKLEPLMSHYSINAEHFAVIYGSIWKWAMVFTFVAIMAGLVVAYSLLKPVRMLLAQERTDVEDFEILGTDFMDMAKSMRQYIAALEGMTGGVITTDTSGRVTMVNKQALLMLGRGKEEISGSNIREIFSIRKELDAAVSGEVVSSEIKANTPSGLSIMECTFSPIKGEYAVDGVVINFMDTSGIKEIRDELRKTERLANIGSLAVTVAHEVRNPLASIKGFAQLISEDIKPDDPKKVYLDTIIKETDRLNRVVDSLYEMRDSSFEAETLKSMINRVGLLCAHAIKDKPVKISETYSDTADSFLIKDERVFHVIYNIMLNACEAVNPGGEVSVNALREKGRVMVEIANESEITEELIGRLFEKNVSTKGKGRGQGLSIAKKAINLAGGDIAARSEGNLTVFTITLPGADSQ